MQTTLSCPHVGHKSFEKSLSSITVGDTNSPSQISRFIRPYTCLYDGALGITYGAGELQKVDFASARSAFDYPIFIDNAFHHNASRFRESECRIYQFQVISGSGVKFVFGIIVTDGANNLIDYCVDTAQAHKRRPVLLQLIRAICTPASIQARLNH